MWRKPLWISILIFLPKGLTNLLEEWGLLVVIDEFEEDEPMLGVNKIKIISHKEKSEWEMIPKYHIGNS